MENPITLNCKIGKTFQVQSKESIAFDLKMKIARESLDNEFKKELSKHLGLLAFY